MRRHYKPYESKPLSNTVAVKHYGHKPVIVVYVNNPYEDPGETLRQSEQYKFLSEQHGGPYPYWKLIEVPGLYITTEKIRK